MEEEGVAQKPLTNNKAGQQQTLNSTAKQAANSQANFSNFAGASLPQQLPTQAVQNQQQYPAPQNMSSGNNFNQKQVNIQQRQQQQVLPQQKLLGQQVPQFQQQGSLFSQNQQQSIQSQGLNVQQQYNPFPPNQQYQQNQYVQQQQGFIPQNQYFGNPYYAGQNQYGQTPPLNNFDDDQAIEVKETVSSKSKATFDLQKDLLLSVTSITKALKLSPKDKQVLPVQVSVKTAEVVQANEAKAINQGRPGIDLVCVIDCSGSMRGQKIELVRQTMHSLMALLGADDRLCLVRFESYSTRITPLLRVQDANIGLFNSAISQLVAQGGNDIAGALDLAFKTLQQRRVQNSVSSVFLLSDGIEPGCLPKVEYLLKNENLKALNFTVHTFGFGSDHDPVLMDGIAKLRDGSFYYVQNLESVDEHFVDALGGLFSVVAQDVRVEVATVPDQNALFKGVNVCKTYGDLWKRTQTAYSFQISQLMSGVSKDFMLELEIPPVSAKVDDHARNTVLLEAKLSCRGLTADAPRVQKNAILEITIYNADEQIAPEIDAEVEVNILRVRGAEALQRALEDANRGQFQQGQQHIMNAFDQIQKSSNNQDKRLQALQSTLQECARNCSNRQQYQQQGQQIMQQQQRAQMEQRSYQPSNGQQNAPSTFQSPYSNQMQQQMVQNIQSKKQSSYQRK